MASDAEPERRWRLIHRLLPLGVLAVAALIVGVVAGSSFESPAERAAQDFVAAWQRGDTEAMHSQLSASAASRYPLAKFRDAYRQAQIESTADELTVGDVEGDGDQVILARVGVSTRIFGTVRGTVRLRMSEDSIDWTPELVFPGLRSGESLERESEIPQRAMIVSSDGKTLAEGPSDQRSSPADGVGSSIAGQLAPAEDDADRRALYARGFPQDTPVGTNGLERALQLQVEGRPGGILRAGSRVLARSSPAPADPVNTTIDTRLQASSEIALADRFGGIAVLDPRTAEVRALSGVAFSAPQPPGSTFKIITATAALEARQVTTTEKFPVVTEATIDGVPLENANGELCGGTFAETFAHSCNSVFAPLGVKVGAKRLVAAAERFGFNRETALPGEAASTIPAAGAMTSPLEIGSTAIGQGRVLATPLQMASVAQTIANDGVRVDPTLIPGRPKTGQRVTSVAVARKVERMMEGVTAYGTGTAAAVPGIKVAGKTGTAELEDTRGPLSEEDPSTALDDPSNTDAWFTAFAPARDPSVVVAVLLVRNGSGGETAAPAAREVLATALGR